MFDPVPIALITLAESGRFAIAQYPEGTAVSPHCILIAFKEENYGKYGCSLKNLLLLEFNIYDGLEPFLKIRNAEITVFLSFLLGTVVTATKSQDIK
ncbi:hypothetical protein [Acidaminococcus intestini]|uniref:hypothetical protein n=1 Tax=Acidaminococcus intestini TaxID=187327 RepID=UPI00307C4A0F